MLFDNVNSDQSFKLMTSLSKTMHIFIKFKKFIETTFVQKLKCGLVLAVYNDVIFRSVCDDVIFDGITKNFLFHKNSR